MDSMLRRGDIDVDMLYCGRLTTPQSYKSDETLIRLGFRV